MQHRIGEVREAGQGRRPVEVAEQRADAGRAQRRPRARRRSSARAVASARQQPTTRIPTSPQPTISNVGLLSGVGIDTKAIGMRGRIAGQFKSSLPMPFTVTLQPSGGVGGAG